MLRCVHARCRVPDGRRAAAGQPLAVTVNAAKGRVRVTLPVESLQNATYAFRFAVTDCAAQTTQSGSYYFKVFRDAPPVIIDGPFLTDTWQVLPTSAESAIVT